MCVMKTSGDRMTSGSAPGSSAYSGWKENGVHSLSASLTLEAALSLPLFLFFLLAVMSFLVMLHVQMYVQNSMEDLSRRMGKAAYLMERGDAILGGGDLDSDSMALAQAGINSVSIQMMLAADGSLGAVLDSSRVKGGRGGLYTYASSYDAGSGILDMIVSYDYDIPWLPGFFGDLRVVQRARSHVWTGDTLHKHGGDESSGHQTVYVTETGTVYHTSPDCNYLDLSIRGVSAGQVSGLRNASGARYQPCEDCARSGAAAGTVYITNYGTSWHNSLSCSGLKRTIKEVDLEELGGMRMCTKCAQGVAHSH